MSLARYFNQDQLLSINSAALGQLFTTADLSILENQLLVPVDGNIVNNQVSEVHIYSFYGDYILGNHNAGYSFRDDSTNSLLIDIGSVFREANISKGSYIIALNLFQEVWGNKGSECVIVKEISPDRTEIHFQVDKRFEGELEAFEANVQRFIDNNELNNLVANFGFNQIQKIINIRFEGNDIYVKFYQPIFDEIETKNRAWFQFEVIDPYIDTILLTQELSRGNLNYLKGPNFDIDTTLYSSQATVFKNWNDLLDANLPTQQRIIEQTLSGSGIKLNIDYTDFNNFIFYSSAEERVKNYKYKVEKVEEYSSSIAILLATTASNTFFISSSVDINQKRIDGITSGFDQWERWLYYEPTSSIFTHDISGSITPQPKRLVSGSWKNHPFSSSLVQNWYNTLVYSASVYDQNNQNRLWWSIPEHIIMDGGNSDFVTFVDMIGHHFDEIYSYVNALTQIHERDEHPQRGTPNELLWHVAKGFGWQLQNTHQTADLWKYQLGMNQSGSFDETGSLFSLTGANQTHQIWRRIVNNLPYLLKTKGTSRSVKALLSIYGIPQTLISIKEYGGPSQVTDRPSLIEDRYYYRANFTGSNWIELNRGVIPLSSGSWGSTTYGAVSVYSRVPDTIEFNFATTYTSSVSMSLWAIEDGTDRSRVTANLQLIHKKHLDGTSSYSGSNDYGKLKLSVLRWRDTVNLPHTIETATSEYLPFFDGDPWSIQLTTNYPFTQSNTTSTSITVSASKASDSLFGRISQTSSFSITATGASSTTGRFTYSWGAGSGSQTTPHIIMLGGTTGSMSGSSFTINSSSRFIGNIYGYKEYFEKINGTVFNSHTLNPSAYHGNNETSSFNALYRYYPLGLDVQRWDHSVYQNVSSSQPNRVASFWTTASFKNWQGTQAEQYDSANETFYISTPSIGGNVLRSEKIRLEDTVLVRDLSPTARSEKGVFDRAGFDSNRLAIVFAPSDQVNNDIYNHSGYFELDSWLGDPEYEFNEGYSELNRFSNDYFKKYQSRYDINALIRLLALYDYTFFEQVKQLIPGRADAVLGILIENDALHQSKVVITKRPEITNPQYEATVPTLSPSYSGEYPTYEGTASLKPLVEARYKYITGSIKDPLIVTGSSLFHTSSKGYPNGIIDCYPTRYSGSQAPTQSYIDGKKLNCCYSKVIYHYSSSGQYASQYEKNWYTAVSMSYNWYYSRSLECTSYQYQEGCAVENRSRFGGSRLEGAGININSSNTIDGGPVVTVWEVSPTNLEVGDSPLGGKLIVR